MSYADGLVTIINKADQAIGSFDVSGNYTSANFALSADGSGHLLVSYVAAAANIASDASSSGSLADLLGRHDSHLAAPFWKSPNDGFAFSSWSPPLRAPETYLGGFDFRQPGNSGGMSYAGEYGHAGPGGGPG